MSDSTTDWPYRIRLVDGGEIDFRLDDQTESLIPFATRAIFAEDVADFIADTPGVWLHGEVRDRESGAAIRAALDSRAISLIMDAPTTVWSPPPDRIPLASEQAAVLGREQFSAVQRRAIRNRARALRQMADDLRAIRDQSGLVDPDIEWFFLSRAGWSPDQVDDHYVEARALLETSLMGGAA